MEYQIMYLIREIWHKAPFEQIKKFLDSTENLNLELTDSIGCTPLGQALINNDTQIIKLLLDKGANPNTKSRGTYPIFYAIEHGNIQVLKYLIGYGAILDRKEKDNNPLFHAIGYGTNYPVNSEIFKFLVDAGSDINYVNSEGISLILILAYWNLTELFEYIFMDNVLPNINDCNYHEYNGVRYKFTVFYYSCYNFNESIAKLLITNGVDYSECLQMVDKYGTTLVIHTEKEPECKETYVLESDADGCQTYRPKTEIVEEQSESIDFVKIVDFAKLMVSKYSK